MSSETNSDQLRALHERYQESLLSKASALETEWLSLPSWDSQQCKLLHANLHQLAGSLGMYGYDQAAEQARQLMQELNTEDLDFSNGHAKLSRLVAALRLAAQQAQP